MPSNPSGRFYRSTGRFTFCSSGQRTVANEPLVRFKHGCTLFVSEVSNGEKYSSCTLAGRLRTKIEFAPLTYARARYSKSVTGSFGCRRARLMFDTREPRRVRRSSQTRCPPRGVYRNSTVGARNICSSCVRPRIPGTADPAFPGTLAAGTPDFRLRTYISNTVGPWSPTTPVRNAVLCSGTGPPARRCLNETTNSDLRTRPRGGAMGRRDSRLR